MRPRVLYIVGLPDDHKVEILFVSPDPARWRYNFSGSVDLIPLLDPDEFDIVKVFCGNIPSEDVTVTGIDAVVNSVCDPDTNKQGLAVVADIEHELGVPIVNPPDRVLETTRDRVQGPLSSLPGVRVPTTTRIAPRRR